MTRLISLVALLAAMGCKSSGPYTVPAAAINAALATGAALHERSQGGCYSVCTNGTVCNPRTGYCEPSPCGSCQPWQACVQVELAWRCVDAGVPTIMQGRPAPGTRPGEVAPGIGVSPATGEVPPPPDKASPRAP